MKTHEINCLLPSKQNRFDWIFRFSDRCFGSCRIRCSPTFPGLRHTSKFAGSRLSQGRKVAELLCHAYPHPGQLCGLPVPGNQQAAWSSLPFPTAFPSYFCVSTQAVPETPGFALVPVLGGPVCLEGLVGKQWDRNSLIPTLSYWCPRSQGNKCTFLIVLQDVKTKYIRHALNCTLKIM